MEPIIIEPEPLPSHGNPDTGDWALHDADFPQEHRPRYDVRGQDRLRRPHFSISQISTWIFARDDQWIKHAFDPKRRGPLVLPHVGELEFRRLVNGRSSPEGGGERRLTLPDIERLAFALHQRGDIDSITLQNAIETLLSVARQYKKMRER